MPHIHEKIDFTVAAYIVHKNRVLFIHHKILKKWLPIGGHIELDENPEQALYREVQEECGLEIEVIGAPKPTVISPGTTFLQCPSYLDIHDISPTHQHICLIYFARAHSDQVKLATDEHLDIRWLNENDFEDPNFSLMPAVRFYAKGALKVAN